MTVFWQIPKNRQNRDKGRGIKKGERIMTEKPDYQVGDIVKLKKPHPAAAANGRSCGWGRIPLKMHWLRPSDHGGQEDGGEEYQRPEKRAAEKCPQTHEKSEKRACI